MVNRRILIIALLLGLTTAGAAYVYFTGEIQKAKKAEILYPVLMARVEIPTKSFIADGMIELKMIPKQFILPGAITERKSVVGKLTLVPIMQGEQLVATKIADKDPSLGLSLIIPENMRAVSVRVDETSSISGLIKPGDNVDIMCTFSGMDAESGGTRTVTILQNKRILAINQQTESRGSAPAQAPGSLVVTFALPLKEAEKLTLAASRGRLSLALRPISDESVTGYSGTDFTDVAFSNTPGGAVLPGDRIRIIKGTQVQSMVEQP